MNYRRIDKSLLLSNAARRVASDPAFMASVLQVYSGGRFDVAELAHSLGTDELSIVRLALCKRPRTRSDLFTSDLNSISGMSGIAVEKLAAVVRRADALEAFRANTAPLLMAAARNRIDPADPGADES